MKVLGIDASLSSTGLCVAELAFEKSYQSELLEILTQENYQKPLDFFEKSFIILHQEEVKEDKAIKKEWSKIRKEIREKRKKNELPSANLIQGEEEWGMKRMLHQTKRWFEVIDEYKPDMVIMEDYAFSSYGSTTQLAELKGIFKFDFFSPTDGQFRLAPITTLKKIASTMGNGNKDLICQNMQRFGFVGYEKKDDMLDAVSIALATFYALYNILWPFEFPKPQNPKERSQQKSWKKCLDGFSQHMGTKDEVESWIKNSKMNS